MFHRHGDSARRGWGVTCVIVFVLNQFVLPVDARGQCSGTPTQYQNGVIENCVSDYGLNASVAVQADNEFIVAWQTPWYPDPAKYPLTVYREDVLVRRLEADAEWLGNAAYLSDLNYVSHHYSPSVAMNADGDVRLAWVAYLGDGPYHLASMELWTDFDFDTFSFSPKSPVVDDLIGDISAGVSDSTKGTAWANAYDTPDGLVYDLDPGSPTQIRDPGDLGPTRRYQYQPCMAMRPDGLLAIVFSEPEEPDNELSYLDVSLRLLADDGTQIGDDVLVNQPDWEGEPTNQVSSAAAIDNFGQLLVA